MTESEALILSAVALRAYAEGMVENNVLSVTPEELMQAADAQLVYLSELVKEYEKSNG